MYQNPFFSVIMPIYKAGKHLEKAINSVLRQTFSDFELILVDDCSPDESGEICDIYSQKDDRIMVMHLPKNLGVSNARNKALECAKGRYVTFIDADDYISAELYDKVVLSAKKFQFPKVLIWGLVEEYYIKDDELSFKREVTWKDCYLNQKNAVRYAIIDLEQRTLFGYVWNKFYDLSYIRANGVKFDIHTKINEDFLFNVSYFQNVDNLVFISLCMYHYIRRDCDSATSNFIPNYFPLHHKRVQLIFDQYAYWNMLTDYVKSQLSNIFIRYIFSALQRNCDERAHLTHLQRKIWLTDLFDDSLYRELIPFAKPQSHMMQLLYLFLKRKQIFPCLLSAQVISLVKNKMPIIFSKLKQNR